MNSIDDVASEWVFSTLRLTIIVGSNCIYINGGINSKTVMPFYLSVTAVQQSSLLTWVLPPYSRAAMNSYLSVTAVQQSSHLHECYRRTAEQPSYMSVTAVQQSSLLTWVLPPYSRAAFLPECYHRTAEQPWILTWVLPPYSRAAFLHECYRRTAEQPLTWVLPPYSRAAFLNECYRRTAEQPLTWVLPPYSRAAMKERISLTRWSLFLDKWGKTFKMALWSSRIVCTSPMIASCLQKIYS